nr:hypothetical protein [Tanacetum cinerariifolium]
MPASDIPVPASDTETVHHDSEPARPSHKRCSVIPEAMTPDAPVKLRRVDARCWNFVKHEIDNWRHKEGEPRYEMEEGPLAQIHPITGEPIHRTIPLLVARLVHLDRQIDENYVHRREVSVARVETSEQEIEALRARAGTNRGTNRTLSFKLRIQSLDCISVSVEGFRTERAFEDLKSILVLDNRLVSFVAIVHSFVATWVMYRLVLVISRTPFCKRMMQPTSSSML